MSGSTSPREQPLSSEESGPVLPETARERIRRIARLAARALKGEAAVLLVRRDSSPPVVERIDVDGSGLSGSVPDEVLVRALAGDEPVVRPDAVADSGARTDDLARAGIRFFAGCPVPSHTPADIGALAVFSAEPLSDDISPGTVTEVLRDATGEIRRVLAAPDPPGRHRSAAASHDESGAPARFPMPGIVQKIFETSAAAITVLDRHGRIVRANERAETVLGLSPNHLRGRAYDDPEWQHTTVDGDPLPGDEQPFVRVKETGEPVHDARHAIRWPDGRRRVLSINGAPLLDADGEFNGAVFVVTDITTEIEQQQALQRRQMLLKESQRIAHLGHWDWDVADGSLEWSDETYRIFGYAPQEKPVTIQTYLQAVPPDDRQRIRRLTRRALQTGEMPTVAHRICRPDGSERVVELTGVAIEDDPAGRPRRVIGTVLDVTERHRREQDLRRSKLALEQAQEITKTGNGIWDLETNRITLSEEAGRLLGLDHTDTHHLLTFFRLIHPLDRPRIKDEFRSLSAGAAFDEEYRIRPAGTDQSEVRWVRGRGYTVAGTDARPTRVFGTVADITERKRRETIEQRFGRLLDSVVSEIYVFDARTLQFVQANRGARQNSGYTAAELESMTPVDLKPTDRTEFESLLEPLRAGEAPVVSFETTHRRRDGSTYPVRAHIRLSRSETPPVFIAVVHDITDQKRREDRLQALYDASSALTRATSPEQLAAIVQTLVTETLGYPICAVRYVEDGQLVPVTTSEACRLEMGTPRPTYAVDGDSNAAAAYRQGEAVVLRVDEARRGIAAPGSVRAGAYVPVGSHGVISIGALTDEPVRELDVQLVDILAQNAASVLDRIDREAELRRARDEAEEMNRLKTALLANMSHEIRTPLTAILGFVEILVEEDLGDPADHFIDLVFDNSQRLLQTLNSVLDLSQIEAGTVSLQPEPTDVRGAVEGVVRSFAGRASRDGVDLAVRGETVRADVDPSALQRIATNLVGNAVKFTPEGGRVTVSVEAAGDAVVLRVADTGIGIDPAFVDKMFEAFQQESSGTDREYEGSGLGLTITQRLVQEMGGAIDVETTKGEGTTMIVRLPAHDAASEDA